MAYLNRAIADGYAFITGDEGKQWITYVSSDNHKEKYSDPEEQVRAEFWAELIYEYDYPANRIKIEVTIPDRVPTDRADIVIFSDDECKKPYAVVECKKDGVTDAEFLQAIEQGVGNATWVKLRASYVVIIAGATRRVICGPFGSAIKTSDYKETGIPLVRITNISKDGYMDYSDIIYISEELGNSLSRTQVSKGDIVISQRGSLGQCAVVDDTFPVQNISANIIAVKNIKEVSAQFIHDYLLSAIGQKLLERSTSGQVQQKITTQDIADILIPIGFCEEQVTSILQNAYNKKKIIYSGAII